MDFQIFALDAGEFNHLFGQDSRVLSEQGIERLTVDGKPGFPCRVSLCDAEIGESVLLMNYEHQPAPSPFRSSHAIFVTEGADTGVIGKNHVPDVLCIRLLSVRAFDSAGMMVDADIVDGRQLEPVIDRMLSIESVACLHLHNAQRGCFIARVEPA